ncbi:MAG: hypothetical protein GKR91_05140 [Pseudomonadales bacterium]|nr:hypothetical protein [Pseudomonadales bacterium]
MLSDKKLTLQEILKSFKFKIGVTWILVALENVLLALIPLLIGLAIDDLLAGRFDALTSLGIVMVVLTFVAVARRIYDTRAYGTIRVELGKEVSSRHGKLEVSARNARLDMSRELVDFLEQQVPEVLTGVIQIIVSLIVLALFHMYLAVSAFLVTLAMIVLYSFFHGRFYTLNASLNGQMEQQVGILGGGNPLNIINHLKALRKWEVKISDSEAVLYGVIFLMVIAFILYNIWFGTSLPEITTGTIYSIISYSWAYVEAAIVLPFTLQSLTRLHEITERINRD